MGQLYSADVGVVSEDHEMLRVDRMVAAATGKRGLGSLIVEGPVESHGTDAIESVPIPTRPIGVLVCKKKEPLA